jgi:phosphoribosyl 1,2-cyclic phosphodiesterase
MLKAGIDCYMAKGTAKELGLNGHRVHLLENKTQCDIGSWTVVPFRVVHDVENMGLLVTSHYTHEKAVYITDTSYSPHRFTALSYILIECNFSKRTLAPDLDPAVKRRLYRNHFSLENVKKFLKANDLSLVREIHLLHLSSGNSDAALFRAEIEKLTGKPVLVVAEE